MWLLVLLLLGALPCAHAAHQISAEAGAAAAERQDYLWGASLLNDGQTGSGDNEPHLEATTPAAAALRQLDGGSAAQRRGGGGGGGVLRITEGAASYAEPGLVVAFAVYGPGALTNAAFLLSLRASGYRGRVILGVHPELSDADKEALRELQVSYAPVETFHTDEEPCHGVCMKTAFGDIDVSIARYFFYREALHAAGVGATSLEPVLIADFRDAYFQRHPFRDLRGKNLVVSQESGYILTSTYWNFSSSWIASCFGDDVVKGMESYPVTCSGVTLGAGRGMWQYLHVFLHALKNQLENGTPEQRRTGCRTMGVDQGIHNYIVYAGLLVELETSIEPNGFGPVNTVGANCSPGHDGDGADLPTRPLLQDADGQVINQDGSVSAVVHQYDRCPELSDLVHREWVPKWREAVNRQNGL